MKRVYRRSKIMELIMYITNKPAKVATYPELYDEFVVRRRWPKSTLDAYLSRLSLARVLRRSWLEVGAGKRIRVYRLSEEFPRQG